MFTDTVAFLDEDHVVPGQLVTGQSLNPAPVYYFLPDPVENAFKKCKQEDASRDRQLWADIVEDVLALEEISETTILNSQPATALVPNATADTRKRPEPLKLEQLQTPDFALLINADTPEPRSPGVQEVPFLSRTNTGMTLSNSQSPGFGCDPNTLQSQTLSQSQVIQATVAVTAPAVSQTRSPSPVPTTSSAYTQLQNATRAASPFNDHYSTDTNTPNTSSAQTTDLMDSIIHIRNSMIMDYNPFELLSSNALDFAEDPDAFLQGGTSGVVLEERIRYTCTVLDIPMDPNAWTVEQVQKWAMFVLKSYEGSPVDPDSIIGLTVNGATLTTMTKENLISYFPSIGETLYNELEVWCFGLTSPFSSAVVPQMTSEPAYVDLDTISKNTYHDMGMASLESATLTCNMTSSLPSVTSSECVLPPLRALMPSQLFVKQEVPDVSPMFIEREGSDYGTLTSRCSADTSPVASPFDSSTCYSSSASSGSSGSCSPDDMFEDHAVRRHVLPPRTHGGKHTIQLWQFLKDLLCQPQFESCIRWLDRGKGIFKIEDSAHVAKLWGRRKNRPAMNYDKLSRSIRQYYKKGIIKKTCQSKRLVYQFCPQYNG